MWKGKEGSEQRVELSILFLFAVTIFLNLSDFQLRLKRRATMETKQWCSCKSEWKQSWVNLILSEIGRNAGEIWPREETGRAMKSGVSRENREGWQVWSWRQRNLQIWISLYQIRCSPIFRDLGMEEKREGWVFWHLVSSLEHRGHIFMYKRRTKVHFAW